MTDAVEQEKTNLKSSEAQPNPNALLASLHHNLVSVLVRGAVHTIPIQPEVTLLSLASAMGRVFGEIYGGNDQAVVNFRNAIRHHFEDALCKVPIAKLPAQAAPAEPDEMPTAPIDESVEAVPSQH